jgi:hypothetical protein
MSQTAVLVWLSASSFVGSVSGAADLPTFRADLDAFAQAHLLRLEAPRENAASFRASVGSSAYAPDAVAQVESSLEEARNAVASLEQSRALSALERAERVLRDHAELPQSAWLMAEILQLSADVESTAPGGADAEQALRKRAAALEGPRAAPFSDRATLETEASSARPVSLQVQGLEPSDTLEWDGMQAEPLLDTASGEHHARVARNGRLLWAGWVRVADGASPGQLRLPVPETVACSPDDLAQAHFADGRALPAPHARCDSYVLARARAAGGIEAAVCERAVCGQLVIWQRASASPVLATDRRHVWPYALAVTAGVLAATAVVLWRTGAFDRPERATSEAWVYNGQKPMGFRF